MDKLIGHVNSLSLITRSFFEECLADLCRGLQRLDVNDVKLIPRDLTLEAIHALLEIGKMAASRPKTIKALRNALRSFVLRFHLPVDLESLLPDRGPATAPHVVPGARKRKCGFLHPRLFTSHAQKKTRHVLGVVTEVKPVAVNLGGLFNPDTDRFVKNFLKQKKMTMEWEPSLPTEETLQEVSRDVGTMFSEESEILREYASDMRDKSAEELNGVVVLGDEQSVSAAASGIYWWLRGGGGSADTGPDGTSSSQPDVVGGEGTSQKSDVTGQEACDVTNMDDADVISSDVTSRAASDPEKNDVAKDSSLKNDVRSRDVTLKMFKNRDQLYRGIAARCFREKDSISVDHLISRLAVDGCLRITEGSTVEHHKTYDIYQRHLTKAFNMEFADDCDRGKEEKEERTNEIVARLLVEVAREEKKRKRRERTPRKPGRGRKRQKRAREEWIVVE